MEKTKIRLFEAKVSHFVKLIGVSNISGRTRQKTVDVREWDCARFVLSGVTEWLGGCRLAARYSCSWGRRDEQDIVCSDGHMAYLSVVHLNDM